MPKHMSFQNGNVEAEFNELNTILKQNEHYMLYDPDDDEWVVYYQGDTTTIQFFTTK